VAYEIEFAESVQGHLRALTTRERAIVLDAIERELVHEAVMEARHRKPLRSNPIAPWEFRVGQLRVFSEVAGGETPVGRILAVGRKRRNGVFICGREIQL
jgi:mRNA-degrading endonuclease RelE of RelBE toxin-antitoxin system